MLLDMSQKMLWCVILGKDYGFAAECTYLGSADIEHVTAAGDDAKSHIGVVAHETITQSGTIQIEWNIISFADGGDIFQLRTGI